MHNPIKNNLVIELHVPDLNKVKEFYSILGFEVRVYDKLNENELGYLTMLRKDTLGNTLLNFYGGDDRVYQQSYFKKYPKETKRGYEIEITITVDNIEDLYNTVSKELKEYVVRDLKELEDHGVTWKDFRMEDPFGFYIRFTELVDWGQE